MVVQVYESMTTIRRVSRVLWGLLYVYCLVLCSILLIIIFVVLFAPFRIIHPRYERQLQELTQWVWVYLLLGITASAADSKMLITLPEDCGLEEEARVLELLRDRFVFDPEILARFAKLKQQGKRGAEGKRSIIIANHQLYLDWIYIWALMAKLRREGTVKIILKRSLLNIPVFGVVCHHAMVRVGPYDCFGIGDEAAKLYLSPSKLGIGSAQVWSTAGGLGV